MGRIGLVAPLYNARRLFEDAVRIGCGRETRGT